MRRVRGQRTTDSFKRFLLCIFSRTGRNFKRICEVLPNEYTPQWIAARIGPHGHGSPLVMMFDTPCIGTTVICHRTPGSKLPDHCGLPCCLREG